MGGFIFDLFVETIYDTLISGTGAVVLKVVRPRRPVTPVAAAIVGLVVWLAAIAALFIMGYFLFA